MGTMFCEDVLFTADDAEIPSDIGLVVYRERELWELVGKTAEELRAIHDVKKGIDGEILTRAATSCSHRLSRKRHNGLHHSHGVAPNINRHHLMRIVKE